MTERADQKPAIWTAEERAWAHECFYAGDSLEEIAEAASRSVGDVTSVLGSGRKIAPHEWACLSLYTSGATFYEIAAELGCDGPNAQKIPAAAITQLRRKGVPVAYRNQGFAAVRRVRA